MIKYQARVTQIGPLVTEFLEAGIIVLFGANAPEELVEFSIIHDGKKLIHPVAPGDSLRIGEETYTVLAVGEVANTNLANLGHLILKFNGLTEAELPGDICIEAKPLPPLEIGTEITISAYAHSQTDSGAASSQERIRVMHD